MARLRTPVVPASRARTMAKARKSRARRVGGVKVAMLTGGGDCPGLNAVLRAVVRKGERHYGDTLLGFRDGWRGAMEGDRVPLDVHELRGTLPRGGTILGSSRTNPFKV